MKQRWIKLARWWPYWAIMAIHTRQNVTGKHHDTKTLPNTCLHYDETMNYARFKRQLKTFLSIRELVNHGALWLFSVLRLRNTLTYLHDRHYYGHWKSAFGFRLIGLFYRRLLQVRPGRARTPNENLSDCYGRIFYRSDAVPVARSTVSKHWKNVLCLQTVTYENEIITYTTKCHLVNSSRNNIGSG